MSSQEKESDDERTRGSVYERDECVYAELKILLIFYMRRVAIKTEHIDDDEEDEDSARPRKRRATTRTT